MITRSGVATAYDLNELPHDYGTAAFRLTKQDGTAVYDLLREESGCWTCDCPDATFRGLPCKHVGALDALHRAGKLALRTSHRCFAPNL